jgi:hypothetical protein
MRHEKETLSGSGLKPVLAHWERKRLRCCQEAAEHKRFLTMTKLTMTILSVRAFFNVPAHLVAMTGCTKSIEGG